MLAKLNFYYGINVDYRACVDEEYVGLGRLEP